MDSYIGVIFFQGQTPRTMSRAKRSSGLLVFLGLCWRDCYEVARNASVPWGGWMYEIHRLEGWGTGMLKVEDPWLPGCMGLICSDVRGCGGLVRVGEACGGI
jgi:hypothetical protein